MKMIEPKREELLTTWITLYKLQVNGVADRDQCQKIADILRLVDKEQSRLLNDKH